MNVWVSSACANVGQQNPPTAVKQLGVDLRSDIEVYLPKYDPILGKPFSAYVSRFIEDTLLWYRMQEESWSYDSLGGYKKVRAAAWLYHNSESRQKAIAAFAEEKQVSTKKAASPFQQQRSQKV